MTTDVSNQYPTEFKLYKRRWIMLVIFIICSLISYMHFISYAIIADSIVEFYGIPYELVNWTSLIVLVFFVPFIFPGVYLINKIGVRKSLLLATFATFAGTWIKVGGIAEDRFWVYMLGQAIVSIFQVIICALPVPVAAAWFGESEVSTACGLGIFGLQLGIAVGFVVPPMVVHNSGIHEVIGHDLYVLVIGSALVCTAVLTITFLVFEEEPPTPPSYARMKSKNIGKIDFLPCFLRLIKHPSYVILVTSYGCVCGVFYGISLLLNQIVLNYYPDSAEDAGRIGVVMVVTGMVGAVIFGIVMDRFHKFKETTFVAYFGCFVGFLAFSFILPNGLPVVYISSAFAGFFVTGLLPVGYEVAVELTYPEPECISSGLVQIVGQLIGVAFTYLYSYLFYNVSVLSANLTTSGILLLSSIMVLFVRFDSKRQKAQTENKVIAEAQVNGDVQAA